MDESRHSGLGIASFATGLSAAVLLFIMVAVAAIMESGTPGGMDEEAPATMAVGCGIIVLGLAEIAALGLGIAALCQRSRKKLYGILGTVISGVTLLLVACLMVIGLAAGA